MLLLQGDCLELLKEIPDESIDLIFCDLPYGQTSCKWDCKIDLEKLWIEFMRVKKLNTPLFFTTTTKFGVELINSAPKKCFFRYDLVWVKSAPAGFLSARRMPMRKHEMVYVFYEKLPFYDLSSHKHKFVKEVKPNPDRDNKSLCYGEGKAARGVKYTEEYREKHGKKEYDPPLPTSVVKPTENIIDGDTYNTKNRKKPIVREKGDKYDPPLPTSVVKEPSPFNSECYGTDTRKKPLKRLPFDGKDGYDPPLPTSVVKEEQQEGIYGTLPKTGKSKEAHSAQYDPPLPTSVVKEDCYNAKERFKNGKLTKHARHLQKGDDPIYDPPLPTTMLEIKSTRGKHSTEKPVALMEWVLKYYSKEGDVVLDPTMGSGSTGVACQNLNRDFVGFEMDGEIFEVACDRLIPR